MTTMYPNAHYVALHIGLGRTALQETTIGEIGRFQLTSDIWIERLDPDLAKLIIRACDPPNHGIVPIDQDNHLYAWVRKAPGNEAVQFDGLGLLSGAIALSRVIHPTTTGFRYCVWVSELTSEAKVIRAIPFRGTSLDVLLGPGARDWLRARAMILTLRYTALRIGDVALLGRERISRDGGRWRIFLRTEKSGKPVFLPIPAELKAALDVVPLPVDVARIPTGSSGTAFHPNGR